MDQPSTAVSFPIPFTCTSVLSNHLTLAMQAGSLQLARPRLPCSFTGATGSSYTCTARDGSLIVCDTEILVRGKCAVVLTSNRSSRFCPVWSREATPRAGQLVSHYPSLVGTHHLYKQKNQMGSYKNILLWDSRTKILEGSDQHILLRLEYVVQI